MSSQRLIFDFDFDPYFDSYFKLEFARQNAYFMVRQNV